MPLVHYTSLFYKNSSLDFSITNIIIVNGIMSHITDKKACRAIFIIAITNTRNNDNKKLARSILLLFFLGFTSLIQFLLKIKILFSVSNSYIIQYFIRIINSQCICFKIIGFFKLSLRKMVIQKHFFIQGTIFV